jgi:hypothetical protein
MWQNKIKSRSNANSWTVECTAVSTRSVPKTAWTKCIHLESKRPGENRRANRNLIDLSACTVRLAGSYSLLPRLRKTTVLWP